MKILLLLIGLGLACAALAATTQKAEAVIICNARLGGCAAGIVSRWPIVGMHCRMLNFASSKHRGRYFCA